MPITTPCLTCGNPAKRSRCDECERERNASRKWAPTPKESPYRSGAWKRLSKAVKARDAHACQLCGAEAPVRLVTHHLDAVAEGHPILAPMDRLITLCLECHNRIEAKQRRTL
jgi:5-methylcytosine-specific restriction endonuclease McrA